MDKRTFVMALAFAFALAVLPAAARAGEKEHDHAHGPHGGEILEFGDEVAHGEIVHDEKAGKLTLYMLGPDAKTPFPIKEAPKLNLKSKDGNKQLEMKAVGTAGTEWAAEDAILKEEPQGRVQVVLPNGKKYNLKIEHHHDEKKKDEKK